MKFKNYLKSLLTLKPIFILIVVFSATQQSCSDPKTIEDTAVTRNTSEEKNTAMQIAEPKKPLSEDFKTYWYAGNAEITSFNLQQVRYGETRDGTAVMIYVTEPFLNKKQVKADAHHDDNVPVLKLNATKNYLTGIYPYAIMTSSFYPVHDNDHALKLSFSSQEWCGQVYAQLNNRANFEIMSHSYFESEADQNVSR